MRTIIAFITVVSWVVAVPTWIGVMWFGIRLFFGRKIEIVFVAQLFELCVSLGLLPWTWLIVRYSA